MSAARKVKETRADRVIRFCEEYLVVPDGAYVGNALKLREWQKDILRGIYNSQTRHAIITFPRKNGKTSLTAMIVLAHLVGPEAWRNGQVYSAAQSREQAALVFGLAAKMVRMGPLNEMVQVTDSRKELFCTRMGTRYKALSAEAPQAYGLSPVLVIHDELGQVRGPRSELYDALETSMGAQAAPLSIIISTQAPTDADLLSTLIDAANLEGNPATKLFMYAADKDADIYDEATWFRVNPALGDFLSIEEIRRQAKQAKQLPASESRFRNLHLNQRVASSNLLFSPDVWKLNGGQVDRDAFGDYPVYAGLDLSLRTDLTALVLAVRDANGIVHLQPHFFAPERGVRERSIRDKVPYDMWAKKCPECVKGDVEYCPHSEKCITLTPGATVDYEWVGMRILDISNRCKLKQIRYDRLRMDELKLHLDKIGLQLPLEPHGQGFVGMAPAIDAFEALAVNGRIRHGNHPILTWNASNAIVQMDPSGNRKTDKNKATGRIDGLVAALMAVSAFSGPAEAEPTYQMLIM